MKRIIKVIINFFKKMFRVGIVDDRAHTPSIFGTLGKIPLATDMLINTKLMGQEEKLINEAASLILDGSLNPNQASIPTPCGDWTSQAIGQRICFNPWDAVRTPAAIPDDHPWPAEVIIDLGRSYRITQVYMFVQADLPPGGSENSVIIDGGGPIIFATNLGSLTNTAGYIFDEWKKITCDFTGRYIRLQQGRNFGIVAELVLYGQTVGDAPIVAPVVPRFSTTPFDKMVGVDIVSGMGIDQPAPGAKKYDEKWGHIRWFSSGPLMFDGSDNVVNYVVDNATVARLTSKGVKMWYNAAGSPVTTVNVLNPATVLPYTTEKPIDYALRAGTKLIAGNTSAYGAVGTTPANYAHHAWLCKKAAIHVDSMGMEAYEPENEPDIYLRGAGWRLPFELAAEMSACYDGHEGTVTYLGNSVGIKNSGTLVDMIMPALAYSSPTYVKAMAYWFEHNRTDGKFACDAFNTHLYPNSIELPAGEWTGGLSPENSDFDAPGLMDQMKSLRDKHARHAKLYQTEIGWDTYHAVHPAFGTGHYCANTTYGGTNPTIKKFQYAQDIAPNDFYKVQGQWIARAALLHAEKSFDRCTIFWLADRDDEARLCGTFNASGMLLLPDPGMAYVPKPSWYYIQGLRFRLKNMLFVSKTIQNVSGTNATIHKYSHITDPTNIAYVVWFPTAAANTASSISIPVISGTYETVELSNASELGTVIDTTTGTFVTIDISERPILICKKLTSYEKYVNALFDVGRDLSPTEKTAFATFFTGLITDGLDSKIKAFWLPMGDELSTSINIVNPGTFDLTFKNASPTFTATQVQWNPGAFSFADTGFNPSIHLSVANKFSLSYKSAPLAIPSDSISIGVDDNTNFIWLRYREFYTEVSRARGYSNTDLVGANPSTGKLVMLNTHGSNTELSYNATVLDTQVTSGAAPNYTIFLGARSNTGNDGSWETNPFEAGHIGDEFTTLQAINWNTRINTLLSTLGR